jgi:hypothetical protein
MVPLIEQELFIFHEFIPDFCVVRVVQSLVKEVQYKEQCRNILNHYLMFTLFIVQTPGLQ